ncbi:MAG: hypothetical protein JSS34_02000 [Proteobacteria bacterium]|nr:hypothetical protein [Pseudomonadota bacterium]
MNIFSYILFLVSINFFLFGMQNARALEPILEDPTEHALKSNTLQNYINHLDSQDQSRIRQLVQVKDEPWILEALATSGIGINQAPQSSTLTHDEPIFRFFRTFATIPHKEKEDNSVEVVLRETTNIMKIYGKGDVQIFFMYIL